jgi:antitoxin YefM
MEQPRGGIDSMTAMTLNEAKENLEQLINQVIDNNEPAILCTDSGQQVVVLPLDEFNSWKETIYLLSNPANAAHLRKSIQEARAGRIQEKELIDA